MMTLQELVDSARAFLKDCMQISRRQILTVENCIPDNLLKCLERMMFSINGTTDSAILLIEEGCVWDSSILLRSVLDGTARVCYLLSAKNSGDEELRLHEFEDLLPKAEMGGLEQPLSGMIKSHYYTGTESSPDPILDPIKSVVEELKPADGEGRMLREVKARWNFFRISSTLKDEFPLWRDLAPLFEYRYALCNQLVHKTDTGCGQVFERSLREPAYRDLSDLAHSESVLIALCLAMCSRLHTLSARVGANVHDFGPVLRKHQSLFEGGGKIEKAFAEEALKHVSRKE